MFRALVYTILGLFVLAVIRMIMSTLQRGVGEMFQSETRGGESGSQSRQPSQAARGPLKRDPVCGTFVPSDASFHKVVNGETLYFCSSECRDKYPA